jgi:hypothetical protein
MSYENIRIGRQKKHRTQEDGTAVKGQGVGVITEMTAQIMYETDWILWTSMKIFVLESPDRR